MQGNQNKNENKIRMGKNIIPTVMFVITMLMQPLYNK